MAVAQSTIADFYRYHRTRSHPCMSALFGVPVKQSGENDAINPPD